MSQLPDLPTAIDDAARLEAEFIVDPGAFAAPYAHALNRLAILRMREEPRAGVVLFSKAVEVLGHGDDVAFDDLAYTLFNAITALLAGEQPQQALAFAERAIELEHGPEGTSAGRGIALEQKAEALRMLGRHAEELELRLEALGQFALADGEESPVADFAKIVTANTARRIGELLED